MQTLVAYAFDVPRPEAVQPGRDRVESWYAPLWRVPPRLESDVGGRCGLLLWTDPDEASRWSSWAADANRAAASLHVPSRRRRVTATRLSRTGVGRRPRR